VGEAPQPQGLLAYIVSRHNISDVIECRDGAEPERRGFENIATSEPNKIYEYIKKQIPSLAKHQIEELTKLIREHQAQESINIKNIRN